MGGRDALLGEETVEGERVSGVSVVEPKPTAGEDNGPGLVR